jgi:uncharacterized membrane protein YidH (DUF202 family)
VTKFGTEAPGLQAERTLLSWERTALGLLANGALLMLRGAGLTGPPILLPAGVALVLSVIATVIGLHRHRVIGPGAAGAVAAPSIEVSVLGAGVTIVGVLTLVAILL